jgi:uncharacterized membrane protein YfcA
MGEAGGRAPSPIAVPELLPLLSLLPLGLLAGVLSGLLGIGGGLIFSPLLLALGLPAHQALATSTLAIVPTTLAGSWAHLRRGRLPAPAIGSIASGAVVGGLLFSHSGGALPAWLLLALQALLYGGLVLLAVPRTPDAGEGAALADAAPLLPLPSLGLVGLVAGACSGLLGVGGGLVMVPLMVRGLGLRLYLAIRLSTLAVCASAISASAGLLHDGRAQPLPALVLGGTAALAARWAAARLQRVPEARLAALLKLLCGVLALDAARRALQLALLR